MHNKIGFFIFTTLTACLLLLDGCMTSIPTYEVIASPSSTRTLLPISQTPSPANSPTLFPSVTSSSSPSPTIDPSCIPYNQILQAAWSSDGNRFAVTSHDGIYIFNVNGAFEKFIPLDIYGGGIAFTHMGDFIFVAAFEGIAKLDLDTGRIVHIYISHGDAVNTVFVSQDDQLLLGATANSRVRVWSVPTGEVLNRNSDLLKESPSIFPSGSWNVAVSPDFSWVAASVRSWNRIEGRTQGAVVFWNPFNDAVYNLIESFDANRFIATNSEGSYIAYLPSTYIDIVRVRNGSLINRFYGDYPFSFSADGTLFAYIRRDRVGEEYSWQIWLSETEGQNIAVFTPSINATGRRASASNGLFATDIVEPFPHLSPDGSQLGLLWSNSLELFDTEIMSQGSQILLQQINDSLCIVTNDMN